MSGRTPLRPAGDARTDLPSMLAVLAALIIGVPLTLYVTVPLWAFIIRYFAG